MTQKARIDALLDRAERELNDDGGVALDTVVALQSEGVMVDDLTATLDDRLHERASLFFFGN